MGINLIRYKMFGRSDVLISLISLCAWFFVAVKCEQCEEIRPVYSTAIVVCKNLTGSFPAFAKTVVSLKCLDCNMPVLDETTIIGNFKAEVFNLSYSHVQNISSSAFTNFTSSTHKLLFEGNDISYLPKQLFSSFLQLDEISLKKNNISTFVDGTFENTNLSTLDLSHNRIGNISGVFEGLKVNKLNLSCNEIVEVPQNAFDHTIFWGGRLWRNGYQVLDLSSNLIYKIYPNTFKSPGSEDFLSSLYLQNNRITVIENNTFSQMSYLKYLSLEDNFISDVYTDSFKGLRLLATLVLKGNQIKTIPPSMFADLQSLEQLDMSRNRLTTLTMYTFSGLAYLTKLNVSHNNLRVLDDAHIFPLGRLLTLDISDTKLHELNLQAILQHHYKLRVLVINDNFWTCKHLVQMYREMNERIGGFDHPSRHFDVPNLHGIACSRGELSSYDEMTFEEFMEVIAQDRVFEDLFDSRINQQGDVSVDDISHTLKHINSMYHMLLVLTIVILILFLQFTTRCILGCLYRRNIISSDRFSFAYNSSQDDVKLL